MPLKGKTKIPLAREGEQYSILNYFNVCCRDKYNKHKHNFNIIQIC